MTSTNDGDGDGEVELFEPELVLQSTVPDPPVRLPGVGGKCKLLMRPCFAISWTVRARCAIAACLVPDGSGAARARVDTHPL